MSVRSMNKAIAQTANYIPCPHTRRSVMTIADLLSKGMYENKIQGVAISSTAAELNKLDGYTGTAAELNLVSDISGITTSQMNKIDQRSFEKRMLNVSQAQSIYSVIPWSGTITKIMAVADKTASSMPGTVFSFGAGGNRVAVPGFTGNYMSMSTAAVMHGAQLPSLAITSVRGVVVASDIMTFSSRGGTSFGTTASPPHDMSVVFTVMMDIT